MPKGVQIGVGLGLVAVGVVAAVYGQPYLGFNIAAAGLGLAYNAATAPGAPKTQEARGEDQTLNDVGPIVKRTEVYGDRGWGGSLAFWDSFGSEKENLSYVFVIADAPVDQIGEDYAGSDFLDGVYVDGKPYRFVKNRRAAFPNGEFGPWDDYIPEHGTGNNGNYGWDPGSALWIKAGTWKVQAQAGDVLTGSGTPSNSIGFPGQWYVETTGVQSLWQKSGTVIQETNHRFSGFSYVWKMKAIEGDNPLPLLIILNAPPTKPSPLRAVTDAGDLPLMRLDLHTGEPGLRKLDYSQARSYTASAGTNRITVNSHGWSNGDEIIFKDATPPPTPIRQSSTTYYIRNSTPNDFQLSQLPSSSLIDITDGTVGGPGVVGPALVFPYLSQNGAWGPNDKLEGLAKVSVTVVAHPRAFPHGRPQVLFTTPQGATNTILDTRTLVPFTTNSGTDEVTAPGISGAGEGRKVTIVEDSGSDGLENERRYFVINKSGDTFQLSLTKFGAPVNITGAAGPNAKIGVCGSHTNMALVAAHYLTSRMHNVAAHYGLDTSGQHVDLDAIDIAANIADEPMAVPSDNEDAWEPLTGYDYGDLVEGQDDRIYQCIEPGLSAAAPVPSGSGSSISDGSVTWRFWKQDREEPRWHGSGQISSTDEAGSTLQELSLAIGGDIFHNGVAWKIQAGSPVLPPVVDLDSANGDIVLPIEVLPGGQASVRRYNGAEVKWHNPKKLWELDDIPTISDPTSIAQDGGESYHTSITARFAATKHGARRQGLVALKLSRRQEQVAVIASRLSALQVEQGDAFRVSHAPFGWINRKFRCTQMTLGFRPQDSGGRVRPLETVWHSQAIDDDLVVPLVGVDFDPEVFDESLDTIADDNSEINLFDALEVAPPTALSATVAASSARIGKDGVLNADVIVSWLKPADRRALQVDIQWVPLDSDGDPIGEWTTVSVRARKTQVTLPIGVKNGDRFRIRARSVSIVNGIVSDEDADAVWQTETELAVELLDDLPQAPGDPTVGASLFSDPNFDRQPLGALPTFGQPWQDHNSGGASEIVIDDLDDADFAAGTTQKILQLTTGASTGEHAGASWDETVSVVAGQFVQCTIRCRSRDIGPAYGAGNHELIVHCGWKDQNDVQIQSETLGGPLRDFVSHPDHDEVFIARIGPSSFSQERFDPAAEHGTAAIVSRTMQVPAGRYGVRRLRVFVQALNNGQAAVWEVSEVSIVPINVFAANLNQARTVAAGHPDAATRSTDKYAPAGGMGTTYGQARSNNRFYLGQRRFSYRLNYSANVHGIDEGSAGAFKCYFRSIVVADRDAGQTRPVGASFPTTEIVNLVDTDFDDVPDDPEIVVLSVPAGGENFGHVSFSAFLPLAGSPYRRPNQANNEISDPFDFSTGNWVNANLTSRTPNAIAGPNALTEATELVDNGGSLFHRVRQDLTGLTNGETYELMGFFKEGSVTQAYIEVDDGTTVAYVLVDLLTDAILDNQGVAEVHDAHLGWTRLQVQIQITGTTCSVYFGLAEAGSKQYTGGSGNLYVSDADFRLAGAVPTPPQHDGFAVRVQMCTDVDSSDARVTIQNAQVYLEQVPSGSGN